MHHWHRLHDVWLSLPTTISLTICPPDGLFSSDLVFVSYFDGIAGLANMEAFTELYVHDCQNVLFPEDKWPKCRYRSPVKL
jgi:hypothetical protein